MSYAVADALTTLQPTEDHVEPPAIGTDVGVRQGLDGDFTLVELGSEGSTWLKSEATVDVDEWQ